MTIVHLSNGELAAKLSTAGSTVLELWWNGDRGKIPLLRPAPSDDAGALEAGCFPLAPFGNRVRGNRFEFAGQKYDLTPNVDWDAHYLHGDAWLGAWEIAAESNDGAEMVFYHEGSPYTYEARQRFRLADGHFEVELTVENKGKIALPFGLGWHPYFPLTSGTTLLARARRFWTEAENWLPGEATEIPADLDFSRPRPLPHRWVNNGFEGWTGQAEIDWPELGMQLLVEADALFEHAFLFVSDTAFDPTYKRDFFCFEPMSHLADAHNMAGGGGLVVLEPGQTLSGRMRLTPQVLTQ
jgi:aldose 1-epimerase